MSEGRKVRIVLLHDKHLDILVQPKLLSMELMEMAASHLTLREKDYFGLSYREDAGHYQWLTSDRRVLDHDLPKNQKPVLLYFQVRLYVESICQLKDPVTIELFYLNARQAIAQERLKCDSTTVFELAAYVLQEAYGDYTEDSAAHSEMKSLPLLPVGTLKEHPSISFCEDEIILRYKKLTGMSRGFSIVNYMKIVESLPSYGIHFYEVKDKAGLPWWLGLSIKGITVHDFSDRFTPRKEYHWKQLMNLYYKDRKFSIQVHDSKSEGDGTNSLGSKSRRPFSQGQSASVHSWFSSSSQLTKSIWSMAVCQHQKYIDLRTAKSKNKNGVSLLRNVVEVASDLSNNSINPTTPNASDCSSLSAASQSSASNSKVELNEEISETYKAAMQDMFNALKQKKETLESHLVKKTKLLLDLCLQEAELTGFLPPETPITNGDPTPKVRRRIGTAYTLSPKVLSKDNQSFKKDTSYIDDLEQLEIDLEIQDKITQAALMLSQEKSVRRSVRKKRTQSYQRASQKLKEMEAKLLEHQLQTATRKDSITAQSNISDGHMSEDSRDILDSENEVNSAVNSPLVVRHKLGADHQWMTKSPVLNSDGLKPLTRGASKVTQSSSEQSLVPLQSHVVTDSTMSSPCSPVVENRHRQMSSQNVTPSPTPSPMATRQWLGGYVASSIYSTQTQYRSQRYPTLCGIYAANQLLDDDGDASSSSTNVYNVSLSKTSYYDSGDELNTPSPIPQHPQQQQQPQVFFASPCGSTSEGYLPEPSQSSATLRTSESKLDSSRMVTPSSALDGKLSFQCCALPPSDVIRSTCGAPPSDIIRSTYGAPPSDVIRSTCHVVTSVSRSCYGSSGAHVVENVRTETSRVFDATRSTVDSTERSLTLGEESSSEAKTAIGCETTVQKYHNYIEISKPFEMSDFYKYSEKLRRQRLVKQMVCLNPSLTPSVNDVVNSESNSLSKH